MNKFAVIIEIKNTINSFLEVRKQTLTGERIIFCIEKIIVKLTKNNTVYSEIGDELNDFNNDNVQFEQPVRGISESDTGRKEKMEQNDDMVTMIDHSAKSQDFFQNNK